MTLRTLEGLQLALERSLSWRKKELVGIRISAIRSQDKQSYLFRSGLVLACAHWEGFLRESLEHYIGHVFAQSLSMKELSPVFVAQAIYADVQRASQADYPGSIDTHIRLAKRIQLGLEIVPTKSEWKVKTEANPGTGVVAKLLSSVGLNSQLGLDEATWSTTKVFIDDQLVNDRNHIAHGEGLPVTKVQLLERSGRVITLLDRLTELILQAAEVHAYKST